MPASPSPIAQENATGGRRNARYPVGRRLAKHDAVAIGPGRLAQKRYPAKRTGSSATHPLHTAQRQDPHELEKASADERYAKPCISLIERQDRRVQRTDMNDIVAFT